MNPRVVAIWMVEERTQLRLGLKKMSTGSRLFRARLLIWTLRVNKRSLSSSQTPAVEATFGLLSGSSQPPQGKTNFEEPLRTDQGPLEPEENHVVKFDLVRKPPRCTI